MRIRLRGLMKDGTASPHFQEAGRHGKRDWTEYEARQPRQDTPGVPDERAALVRR